MGEFYKMLDPSKKDSVAFHRKGTGSVVSYQQFKVNGRRTSLGRNEREERNNQTDLLGTDIANETISIIGKVNPIKENAYSDVDASKDLVS